jgi:titin
MPRSARVLLLAVPLVFAATTMLPATAADAVTTAPTGTTATSAWFQDPLTPVQRAALMTVPSHPRSVHGPALATRALWKSHGGALAVPAITAVGHQLQEGQAVTLSRRSLFPAGSARPSVTGRATAAALARSLTQVTAVRCEGYTDFGGDSGRVARLARKRAHAICSLLSTYRPGLVTTSRGFGRRVPVVVGGKASQRAANRRVVVLATAVSPVAPPPAGSTPSQQATAPGAPTLMSVTGSGVSASLAFLAPASNGGSPITGYEWSTDQTTWTPLTTTGSSPFTVGLTSLPVGTATYYVRAVNAIGNGPASTGVSGTVLEVPTAPSIAGGDLICGDVIVWFYPGAVDSAAVTGFEFSTDGGQTWTAAQNVVNPSSDPNETQRRFNNNMGGSCSFGGPATSLVMRATSANGPSAPSAPTQLFSD